MVREEEKKKILLVCNYFAPDNAIAAVRISKLAKYFTIYGYQVDALTEKKDDFAIDDTLLGDAENVNILYAKNSEIFKAIFRTYQNAVKPYRDKRLKRLDNRESINSKTGHVEFYPFQTAYPIFGSLDYIIGELKQLDLARSAKSLLTKSDDYDFLITSYGASFGFFVGKRYKKMHSDTPWIFDIRDSIYQYKFTPGYVKWIPLMYEKYVWKHADAIVGVSKGMCRRVSKKYRYKVSCITNGFDKQPSEDQKTGKRTDKMCFAYTGIMYGGLRDLSEFFYPSSI